MLYKLMPYKFKGLTCMIPYKFKGTVQHALYMYCVKCSTYRNNREQKCCMSMCVDKGGREGLSPPNFPDTSHCTMATTAPSCTDSCT